MMEDIKKLKTKKMSYLETYIEIQDFVTDAPYLFKEAGALTLLSTIIGRNARYMSNPTMKLTDIIDKTEDQSGMYLNTWFLLIGKSRVARKTTSINWIRDIINSIDNDLILPDGFTPQALVQELSRKQKNNETRAIWINDEIGSFFQQMKETKYMLKTDTILSKLYDCNDYSESTIGAGRRDVINPYFVSTLASTEDLPRYFTEATMTQGFGNRFIYVFGVRKHHKELSSNIPASLKFDCVSMIEWLKDIYNLRDNVPMTFDDEALNIYIKFEKSIEKEILAGKYSSMKEGYIGNVPTSVLKLSCIYAISSYYPKKLSTFPEDLFLVGKEHVIKAIKRIEGSIIDYDKFVDLMSTKTNRAMTDEQEIEMVFNHIKAKGTDGIPRTELSRKSKLLKRRLDEIIVTLKTQDRITRDKRRPESGTGGNDVTYYTVKSA